MKKFSCLTFLSLPCLWLTLSVSNTHAADFAVADAQLKACLQDIAQSKQWPQPQDFLEIKCHSQGIQSLEGLEQFSQIETLSLHNNQLQQLDINFAKFKNLKQLNLAKNNLEQVTLKSLPSLEKVFLFANHIKKLQLIDMPQLQELKTNNNEIISFHYDNTPQLKKIYIFNNQLETINIHDLPALQYMDCRENPMPDELYDEMDRMDGITFLHDGNAEDW